MLRCKRPRPLGYSGHLRGVAAHMRFVRPTCWLSLTTSPALASAAVLDTRSVAPATRGLPAGEPRTALPHGIARVEHETLTLAPTSVVPARPASCTGASFVCPRVRLHRLRIEPGPVLMPAQSRPGQTENALHHTWTGTSPAAVLHG